MQISEYNVHDPDVVLMNNNLPRITDIQERVTFASFHERSATAARMLFSFTANQSFSYFPFYFPSMKNIALSRIVLLLFPAFKSFGEPIKIN